MYMLLLLYQKALKVNKSAYTRRWNLFEQLEVYKHHVNICMKSLLFGHVTIHKTTKNLIKNYHDSYLVKYPDVDSNLLSRYIALSILSLSPTCLYFFNCTLHRNLLVYNL